MNESIEANISSIHGELHSIKSKFGILLSEKKKLGKVGVPTIKKYTKLPEYVAPIKEIETVSEFEDFLKENTKKALNAKDIYIENDKVEKHNDQCVEFVLATIENVGIELARITEELSENNCYETNISGILSGSVKNRGQRYISSHISYTYADNLSKIKVELINKLNFKIAKLIGKYGVETKEDLLNNKEIPITEQEYCLVSDFQKLVNLNLHAYFKDLVK